MEGSLVKKEERFYLEVSCDRMNFKPFYIEHRLRKYSSIQNSINGASHVIRGKGNYKIIRIVSLPDKIIRALVTIASNGKTSIRYLKDVLYSTIPYIDGNSEKEGKGNINEDNKYVLGTKKTNSNEKSKDVDVIESKLNEMKNRTPKKIKKGKSINNLGDISLKEDSSFFKNFMSIAIDLAIRERDSRLLFKLELKLSEQGYSWYVDNSNRIQVDKTDIVIQIIIEQSEN